MGSRLIGPTASGDNSVRPVDSASYQPGVSPGAWITIFGQNLAASTHAVTTSDLISGNLPTTLNGVSVKIDNQPAYIQYVSPTQINVQAPADSNTGNVQVTLTNASGTSDPITATLQSILPAFFTSQTYVAAVRSDGGVISGAQAARPGDLLSFYGTGFGPTSPSVLPGAVVQTAAALTNPVVVTIGGSEAAVSFAGLSGAGLYQLNVTVPGLPDGDHAVLAEIAGLRTQSGVLLKTQS